MMILGGGADSCEKVGRKKEDEETEKRRFS